MFNLNEMMGRLRQMQQDMGQLRDRLEQIRVTERVGGVSATASGNKRLVELHIAPELLSAEGQSAKDIAERLADETVAAVNRALDAAEAAGRTEVAKITEGLPNLPGMDLPR